MLLLWHTNKEWIQQVIIDTSNGKKDMYMYTNVKMAAPYRTLMKSGLFPDSLE